ncbi:MAG: jacalin-like lectin, partial [Roseateles sp.]|uniref:jacalin-like lectin n=1 Tax=Roseateles sp. TaxID=1971397 RepID=UPI004037494C
DAGNAFKKIGKKKKHKKGPDPKFAASVFDWDYYYDNAPDVVKAKLDLATHWKDSGFNEGRRGSLEFDVQYYWKRYPDVQAKCGRTDYGCTLNHWLDQGLYQGRQGSADFSTIDYLARYADLQQYFGKEDFSDAMDHWQTAGEDEGRNGRPVSSATGPVAGPTRIGGGGGGAWNDHMVCAGRPLTGFRIGAGKRVDRLQFRYADRGWAPRQGSGGSFPVEVNLPDGQYFVRVDYRAGSAIDSIAFVTNTGKTYGPYGGGGGSAGSYNVTPGEKLGCMAGRSGSSTDQLTFYSTGPH